MKTVMKGHSRLLSRFDREGNLEAVALAPGSAYIATVAYKAYPRIDTRGVAALRVLYCLCHERMQYYARISIML